MVEIIFWLFIFFSSIQILFWTVYLWGISQKNKLNIYQKSDLNPISVIIAAHNEYPNLKVLLPQLLNQNYPNFEIIVINDRSTDDSDSYLNNLITTHSNLSVIHQTEVLENFNAKKSALQRGIEKSNFEHLVFIDGDCQIHSNDYLLAYGKKFIQFDVVLGIGEINTKPSLLGLIQQFETWITAIQYTSMAKLGLAYMAVGRNLGYTKKAFQKSSGYKPYENILGGDDDLLIQKFEADKSISIGTVETKESISFSEGKNSWKKYLTQKSRHTGVSKLYNSKSKIIIGMYVLSFMGFATLGTILLLKNVVIIALIAIISLRTLLLFVTFIILSVKMGRKRLWAACSPLLEISYLVYLMIVGAVMGFLKTDKWS